MEIGEPALVALRPASAIRSTPTVTIRIVDVKGLYEPGLDDRSSRPPGTTRGSSYAPGYTSADDRGRIFRNRSPDGTWASRTQYVELTVRVLPAGVPIPGGATIVWEVEEPGDHSADDPQMRTDAAGLFPNARNDPRGRARVRSRLEQIDPMFALSGNETTIDPATRESKVRLHVSDVAGDTYRVKASTRFAPCTSARTGVMTVWDRIELEYVKMASAIALPVNEIAAHYDIARVQVDVSAMREVSGHADRAYLGEDDRRARRACVRYSSRAGGEFSNEGRPGWFFVAAANRFLPARAATILYQGDAVAEGDVVRLPSGAALRGRPAIVRIFNRTRVATLAPPWPNDYDLHVKFKVAGVSGADIAIERHDFHEVDDPGNAFLEADLASYGFVTGTTVPVQVLSAGDEALITGGISPGGVLRGGRHYFGGKLIVFTQALTRDELIITLCHELCHAFDNSHKCGNWAWNASRRQRSCCMDYWFEFVLDAGTPRRPIPWTQNLVSADLCAPHVRNMRDYHLDDNPGLGW